MTKKQAIKVLKAHRNWNPRRKNLQPELGTLNEAIDTAIRLLSKPSKRRVKKPKLQPCLGCGGKSNRKRYRQCDKCHEKMMKTYFEIKGAK